MKFARSSASVAVLAAVACSTAAYAQDDDTRTVDEIVVTAQKREQNLQDVPIVVTAISEQLLTDAGVRDIKDLQVLTPGLTVTSTSNETVTTARIRGVGTVGDNPGLESSVGVIIDGVYRPRNGVSFGDLGEMERIEVLKGPQGTLFGKNTSAGVINIVTKAPEFQFGGSAELTAGDYGALGGSASVTGPILGESVAGRLFVARRQRDGFLDVVTGMGPRTQDDDVTQDFYTVRGQILATPNDDLTVRLIADYTRRDESCCLGTQLFVGTQPGDATQPLTSPTRSRSRGLIINDLRPGSIDTTSTPFDRRAYANRDTNQDIEDKGISAEIVGDLNDDISVTSVTAWRDWRAVTGQDSDFTAADLLYRPGDGRNFVEFGQFSQELRMAGETGRVNWLVGAFYARETLDTRSPLYFGEDFYNYLVGGVLSGIPAAFGILPGTALQEDAGIDDVYEQDGTTFAVFTNNTVNLYEGLDLTLGLRWTRDEKELTTDYNTTGSTCDQAEPFYNYVVGLAGTAIAQRVVGGLCANGLNNDFDALGTFDQEQSEEAWSGTVKLSYRFNDDIMTYGSYSRGYKSGGFNLDRSQMIGTRTVTNPLAPPAQIVVPDFTANPDTSFEGEFADSYELGIKTQWLENSLLLNATAFHQTFTDFQLNTFAGTAFVVETLPEVTSMGVDMDFLYYPPMVSGLTFQGGVTYAETEIGDFTAADLNEPQRFATSFFRLPGATLAFAPLWSGSLATTYEREVGAGLMVRANVSAKYTSKYNTGSDLHPSKEQEAFTLVNARIGLGDVDERWTVELWSQNLTDEDYLQVGFNGPYQIDESNDNVSVYNAFLGAPRTVGVTLRGKF